MKLSFNNICFFLILMFGINYSSAVTVNGKELASIISSDQLLVCTINPEEEADTNVFLSLEKEDITVEPRTVCNIETVKSNFKAIKTKDSLYRMTSGKSINFNGKVINFDGARLSAKEEIVYCGETINFAHATFKSKKVVFVADKFKFRTCFINTDTFQLETSDPDSIIKLIKFKFNKDISIPNGIEGEIDFTAKELSGTLLALGATEISILFNSHAFSKKSKE